MRNNMDDSDVELFDSFLDKVWGIKMKSEETSEEEIVTKKRGRKPKAVTN